MAEQDKAMLELGEDAVRLRRELQALRDRIASIIAERGRLYEAMAAVPGVEVFTRSEFKENNARIVTETFLPIIAVLTLIALAVAHTVQCPYCIDAYTTQCLETGSNPEQMMEAVHVAAVMQAGITLVHSVQMQNHLKKLVL